MSRYHFVVFCATSALFIALCSGKTAPPETVREPVEKSAPQLVRSIPHDAGAFTQGLFFKDSVLVESAGLYGASSLRMLDTNGTIISRRPLGSTYFAEGCAFFNQQIFQITWQEQHCFVSSWPSLACTDTLMYSGEGWGLTADETYLILSNGSDTLYFKDQQLATVRKIAVTLAGSPLKQLNELEFARGKIFANVWFSDFIFMINPATGIVERVIDCSAIVAQEAPSSDQAVLNGIAFNPATNLFYLTGKNWKHLYIVCIP